MRKIGSLLVALGLMLGVLWALAPAASATGGGHDDDHKVWVCKYVGTPGEDERLKDGKNPISVDSNATVGTWFNDAQGRSFVLAVQTEENTGEGNTYIGDLECPEPEGPSESPTPTPTETTPTPTPTESENEEPTPTPTETEVTITPSPSESTSTPTSTPTSVEPSPSDTPDTLPRTGSNTGLLGLAGALAVALGSGVLALTRKPGLHE